MILYHGTNLYVATKIIEDGELLVSSPERSVYNTGHLSSITETTSGYVYLTNNEKRAVRFGGNAAMIPIELNDLESNISLEIIKRCCVFEIELEEKEIEVDLDQCAVQRVSNFPSCKIEKCDVCSVEGCLSKTSCVRCARNLIVGKDIKRYRIYENGGAMIQDWKELFEKK